MNKFKFLILFAVLLGVMSVGSGCDEKRQSEIGSAVTQVNDGIKTADDVVKNLEPVAAALEKGLGDRYKGLPEEKVDKIVTNLEKVNGGIELLKKAVFVGGVLAPQVKPTVDLVTLGLTGLGGLITTFGVFIAGRKKLKEKDREIDYRDEDIQSLSVKNDELKTVHDQVIDNNIILRDENQNIKNYNERLTRGTVAVMKAVNDVGGIGRQIESATELADDNGVIKELYQQKIAS